MWWVELANGLREKATDRAQQPYLHAPGWSDQVRLPGNTDSRSQNAHAMLDLLTGNTASTSAVSASVKSQRTLASRRRGNLDSSSIIDFHGSPDLISVKMSGVFVRAQTSTREGQERSSDGETLDSRRMRFMRISAGA